MSTNERMSLDSNLNGKTEIHVHSRSNRMLHFKCIISFYFTVSTANTCGQEEKSGGQNVAPKLHPSSRGGRERHEKVPFRGQIYKTLGKVRRVRSSVQACLMIWGITQFHPRKGVFW